MAQMGQSLGMAAGLLGLLGLMIVYHKSPVVYAAVVVTVVLSMLVTPLLQSQQVYAFSEEQRARQTQLEADRAVQEQVRDIQAELTRKDFDPHQNPLTQTTTVTQTRQMAPSLETWGLALPSSADADVTAPVAPQYMTNNGQTTACGSEDSGTDTDGDGLTDWQECRLGTKPDDSDTDDDGLNDRIEVLELGTDPESPDSDGDQINDLIEVRGFKKPGWSAVVSKSFGPRYQRRWPHRRTGVREFAGWNQSTL